MKGKTTCEGHRTGLRCKAPSPERLLSNTPFAAASMAKSKREEVAEAKEEDYKFELPPFDERAFIRREVESAKASFYALGLGALGGVLATAIQAAGVEWKVGWFMLILPLVALQPILRARGFSEDVTKPKALIGSWFMIFFTGLSVWILGINVL